MILDASSSVVVLNGKDRQEIWRYLHNIQNIDVKKGVI
jgi:hypothetical protein